MKTCQSFSTKCSVNTVSSKGQPVHDEYYKYVRRWRFDNFYRILAKIWKVTPRKCRIWISTIESIEPKL